jgi:hypothetical protein
MTQREGAGTALPTEPASATAITSATRRSSPVMSKSGGSAVTPSRAMTSRRGVSAEGRLQGLAGGFARLVGGDGAVFPYEGVSFSLLWAAAIHASGKRRRKEAMRLLMSDRSPWRSA